MSVRTSPGVYITEIDKSLGMELLGTGGIGIAVKLNKGPIGKPFVVTSEKDLMSKGGLPMPGFNLRGWHSVDNILIYAGSVALARVEKVSFSSTHNNVTQKFEIPVNTAQLGVCLTGDTVNFDFNEELQMMIKNREIFKTTNSQNVYDIMNEDTGIDIENVDNSILIDNDDSLETYAEDLSFNTKAKSLYKLANLGMTTAVKDDFIPNIENGQVYNHNGKIVDIGNDIYSDHYILTLQKGVDTMGSGTLSRDDVELTQLNGINTSFTSQVRTGSDMNIYWFSGNILGSGNLIRDSFNYKQLNSTNDMTGFIQQGDKVVIDNIEREVSSVTPVAIMITTDAPSDWSVSQTTWHYNKQISENIVVDKVLSDTELKITSIINSTFDSVYYYDGSYVSHTSDASSETGSPFQILSTSSFSNGEYLYIGSADSFNSIYFDLSVLGDSTTSPTLIVEYSTGANSWSNAIGMLDETNSFSNSGYIYLSLDESLWVDDSVNGDNIKWIRISTDANFDITAPVANYMVPSVIPTNSICNFNFSYDEESGVTTIVEKIYGDSDDPSGKTIKGLNCNFYTLLREGSKIVVDINGVIHTRYVENIVSRDTLTFTEGLVELIVEPADAKVFTYSNFYFDWNDAVVGKTIYTEHAKADIVYTYQFNNTPAGYLSYVVKLVSGNLNRDDKISLSKLNSDEWSIYTNTVKTIKNLNKEDNVYFISLDGSISSPATNMYFTDDSERGNSRINNYRGVGQVLFSSTDTSKYLMIVELISDVVTGDESLFKKGWFATDDLSSGDGNWGTDATTEIVDFIHNYEDVILYEHDEHTGDMVMVNEQIVGLSSAIKDRYTYSYLLLNDGSDKVDYIDVDSVLGNNIIATEFIRVCSITPGAWINDENVSIAMCDMSHYNTALVESNGIGFKSLFEFAPDTSDNSLIAFVVIKDDLVVEKYIVSTNPSAKDAQGTSLYILDVINRKSGYVRVLLNTSVLLPNEPNGYDIHFNTVQNVKLTGGYSSKSIELYSNYYYDDNSTVNLSIINGYVEDSDVINAYELFRNKEDVTLGYLVDGEWAGNATIAGRMRDICVYRGDSVAIISPSISDIVGIRDSDIIEQNILNYVNDKSLVGGDRANQFMAIYANCKQVQDVFNDTYVWIPISSDVVGINNSIDGYYDPWVAAAGAENASIRNIIKLGWNPTEEQRGRIYPNRINPVVYFKGEGTYVYGVRSLCSLKSDLSDLYNRKTLNHIEKNLQKFMRQVLFKFNDGMTRGQVVNNIEPFLRNIKSKRGLIDYKIVCDSSNNPMSVIEDNTLVCDVYLKMAHVIEKVELQFIITKASVSFEEATL